MLCCCTPVSACSPGTRRSGSSLRQLGGLRIRGGTSFGVVIIRGFYHFGGLSWGPLFPTPPDVFGGSWRVGPWSGVVALDTTSLGAAYGILRAARARGLLALDGGVCMSDTLSNLFSLITRPSPLLVHGMGFWKEGCRKDSIRIDEALLG